MSATQTRPPRARGLHGAIFDMDGVVTKTARLHARAWKRLFDDYLEKRARRRGQPFRPFDREADYLTYVDGKPRYEGVRSFLESRGIDIPFGDVSDGPEVETACGLGNKKDGYFEETMRSDGVEVFDSTVALVRDLRARGVGVAVVTSSKHGSQVLRLVGLEGLFDVTLDGVAAEELGLRGKPDPDIFVAAAERLGADPARTVVVEDAVSGVQAGRAGGFGFVIGVDRGGNRGALEEGGADVVVSDLAEVTPEALASRFAPEGPKPLPLALDALPEIEGRLAGRRPAVFLDYDGTLSPIVARPDLAVLTPEMRDTVRRLAKACPTAIVSGRALADVAALVGIEELHYAGNHGFELRGPGDAAARHDKGREFLAAIDGFARRIEPEIRAVPGAFVENKGYSLSVHYRQAAEDRAPEMEAAVDRLLGDFPELRKHLGKKVFEIRPRIDWDKGKAVLWLLEALKLDGPDVLPIYLGDDVTDEDAFRALSGRGLGILVADAPTLSAADYSLRDVGEVRRFLDGLASRIEVAGA
jgi:trehalose 6-phosphate phosphatase